MATFDVWTREGEIPRNISASNMKNAGQCDHDIIAVSGKESSIYKMDGQTLQWEKYLDSPRGNGFFAHRQLGLTLLLHNPV